jgi:hypothetical protein
MHCVTTTLAPGCTSDERNLALSSVQRILTSFDRVVRRSGMEARLLEAGGLQNVEFVV